MIFPLVFEFQISDFKMYVYVFTNVGLTTNLKVFMHLIKKESNSKKQASGHRILTRGSIVGAGSFVYSLRSGVQPTLDPSAETFILVQCTSSG